MEAADVSSWGLTFSIEEAGIGCTKTVELIENGADLEVNNDNKSEYIQFCITRRLLGGIQPQLYALRDGFHTLIPQQLLHDFAPEDLDLFLSGKETIDVDDWEKNTKLSGGLTKDSPVVRYFWEIVREMSPDMQKKLLNFCTGSPSVPALGFSQLLGTAAEKKSLFKLKMTKNSPDHLPIAHTCFNRLDLSPYISKAQFKEKLIMAMESENFELG